MNKDQFFDKMRATFPGIWNRPGAIKEGDELWAAYARVTPDAPSEPEKSRAPFEVSPAGVALIQQFEGCAKELGDGRVAAYRDPVGIWTIGWGATRMDGRAVRQGDVITQACADALLAEDVERHAKDVRRALGSALASTSQAQFDALVAFHFNTGAIHSATLTRKHIAGDFKGAAAEFARWDKAGGRVMPGLVRRRSAEAALYRSKET